MCFALPRLAARLVQKRPFIPKPLHFSSVRKRSFTHGKECCCANIVSDVFLPLLFVLLDSSRDRHAEVGYLVEDVAR